MNIIENDSASEKQIADLREAVGWNRMESCYKNELMDRTIAYLKERKIYMISVVLPFISANS